MFTCRNYISSALLRACVVVGFGILTLQCGSSDEVTEPAESPLSFLSLFPVKQAVLVGDGFYYVVTAQDTAGNDLPDFQPKYTSSDPSVVRIEGDNRIQAIDEGTVTITASAGGQTTQATIYVGAKTYDLATLGPPRILNANCIDLSKIEKISRFRSTVGHSYVDGSGETCRSMKHYFQPYYPDVDWTTVDVYAPVSGYLLAVGLDGIYGYSVLIRPRDLPVMMVQLFHINLDPGIETGGWVEAGDHLGRMASSNTSFDIAVDIGSKEEGTLLSYFDTMTDEVFAEYQARGVATREAAIISKEERDADPVPCVGEQQFTVHGTLPDWVVLN